MKSQQNSLNGYHEKEEIISWFKFVHANKTWNEAKENCVSLGGNLFSAVDGTWKQLRFLSDKMFKKDFWIGILTEDHVTWKNVDGDPIPNELLIWGQIGANNLNGEEYHVIVNGGGGYLADRKERDKYGSVCQLA